MSNVIINVLKMSIFSSFIVLLVMFAKKVFGNKLNIKIITFMWIIVLTRLIIPFTINSPINIGNILFNEVKEVSNTQTTAENVSNENQQDYGIYDTAEISSQYDYMLERSYSENATSEIQTKQEESISWIKKTTDFLIDISIWTYTFLIWIAGASAFLIINIYRMIIFCRKASVNKRPLRYKVRQILNENKKTLGIKRNVELIISSHIDMPITFGIINPTIIIPPTIVNTLSYDKIDLIIKHELGHIKRQDIMKTYLWMIARAIHWFNPLITIAFKIYQNDIEFACDYTVTRKFNMHKRIEYSQSLIDVIRMTQYNLKAPLAVHFCKEKLKLEERIMNMIKPQKKSKSAGFTAILLTIIMIIGCFTTACQPTPEENVVQNKDNEEFMGKVYKENSSIKKEEENAQEAEEKNNENVSLAPYKTVGHITYSEELVNGISIKADTYAKMPDVSTLPIYSYRRKSFSNEDIAQIVGFLFEDNTLYEVPSDLTLTKSEIEEMIVQTKYDYANLDSPIAVMKDITDLNYLHELRDDTLKWLNEALLTAPDNISYSNHSMAMTDHQLRGIGFNNNIKAQLNIIDDTMNGQFDNGMMGINYSQYCSDGEYFSYYLQEFKGCYYGSALIPIEEGHLFYPNYKLEEISEQPKTITMSPTEAASLAENAFQQLGADDTIKVANIYYCEVSEIDLACYAIELKRYIDGMPIIVDSTVDVGIIKESGDTSDQFNSGVPYELMTVFINDRGIIDLSWREPVVMIEQLNSNVELIEINDILDTFQQEFKNSYSGLEQTGVISRDYDLVDIFLNYGFSRIPDSNNLYMAIPLWDFYASGEFTSSRNGNQVKEYDYSNIITVNGIDGTRFSRNSGY